MNNINREDIIRFFKNTFPDRGVQVKGDEINMRCPYCGDSKVDTRKRRFWYSITKDAFNCFNGGCTFKCNSGGFKRILRLYGTSQDKYAFLKYLVSSVKIKQNNKVIELDSNEITKKFYSEVYSFNDLTGAQWKKIYKFKESRFLPFQFPIYMGKGRMENRFVIPVYNYGDLIYWTGRAMDNKLYPKYLSLDLVSSEFPFINLDRFHRDRPIIIIESLLDAIMAQDCNITASDGTPSIEQIRLLLKKTDVGVILAFDWDSTGEKYIKNILNKAKKLGLTNKIKIFFCPEEIGKDFNDLVRAKVIEPEDIYLYILKHSESSNLMTQIKMKKIK